MSIGFKAAVSLAIAALTSGWGVIAAAGADFSATMVRHGPDGQVTSGKMFVGNGRTRMEMSQQGREVIRISDQNRRMEWVLFPGEQSYMERGASASPPAAAAIEKPSAEDDPCARIPGMSCRRVGVEDVHGRPAVKWEMTMAQQGQSLTGAQWLDQERGLPLKSVAPDGSGMELKMLGEETIDGRAVEKWEMITNAPNQQPTSTFQWYDPQLELAVREEFPGGYVSKLEDISVGPQPDDLFSVPAGYTRMTMPARGQQEPPAGR